MSPTTTATRSGRTSRSRGSRRVGYLVAVAVDAVILWVVHQLLRWGWPRFLTDDFDELLPIVTVSLVAGIVVNAVYVVVDGGVVRALGDLVTSAIGVAVAVRTYQVFPFDFSSYSHDWAPLARVVVVVAIVGTSIAVVVNVVRLATRVAQGGRAAPDPP